MAGTAALLIVLMAAAALAATWWFDAEALKAEISSRVQGETGLKLEISGDMTPLLFPGVGVQVGPTALRNPPGFGRENLAEFDNLTVRVKLLPLLRGRVALERVKVEGLRLTLLRRDSGRYNFDPLLLPGDGSGPPPVLLILTRLMVNDAALSYVDQVSGETVEIANLNLRIDPAGDDGRAALAASFGFSDPARDLGGEASVSADLAAEPAKPMFSARSLIAETTIRGAGVPGGSLAVEAGVDARFDTSAQSLHLENLELAARGPAFAESPLELHIPRAAVNLSTGTVATARFLSDGFGVEMEGDFSADGLGRETAVRASIQSADFSPAELLRRLGRPLPDSLRQLAPQQARFEAAVSADHGGIRVDSIDVTAETYRLDGRLTLGFEPQGPLNVALKLEGPPLAEERPLVITLSVSARAPEGAPAYAIDEMELTLGPLTARGKGEIRTGGEALSYTASLTLPRFDARALLAYLGQGAPGLNDPTALTRLSAAAVASGSDTELKLDPFTLTLDDTRVRGAVEISELNSAAPAVSFRLQADALNARRYLPPASAESDPGVAGWTSLAAFDALNVNGRLGVDALTVGDWVLNDVQIEARTRNGRLELQTGSAPRGPAAGHMAGALTLKPAAP